MAGSLFHSQPQIARTQLRHASNVVRNKPCHKAKIQKEKKMNTCLCGRDASKQEHTGRCQLDHFISYTGNGRHGFDLEELLRIVGIIENEV